MYTYGVLYRHFAEACWSILLEYPVGVPLPCVAVSPDAIHQHVKTKNEDQRWLHYIAPEYAASEWARRGGEGRGSV